MFRIQFLNTLRVLAFSGLLLANQTVLAACEMSVGWEPWPPYQLLDESGDVSGVDGDLVSAIMSEMGCTVTWVEASWNQQLQSVESGSLDAAIGASRTPEREVWGLFSEAYRQSANNLVVTTDLAGQHASLEAFLEDGKILGVMLEYHYGDDVMALIGQQEYHSQIQETTANEANMKMLARGRLDGILMDKFVASTMRREMGVDDKVSSASIEVSADPIHMLFSKVSVSAETVGEFNGVLARLQADGTIQAILDKYSD
jgi:polar amino acid transport system substrate-binding protein